MRLIILESPYAGNVEANVEYARECVRDALLNHNDAPIASHLLYTQPGILNDDNPDERQFGIAAGLQWGRRADATVVYTDLGISRGMQYGIDNARRDGRPVEYRQNPHDATGGCVMVIGGVEFRFEFSLGQWGLPLAIDVDLHGLFYNEAIILIGPFAINWRWKPHDRVYH